MRHAMTRSPVERGAGRSIIDSILKCQYITFSVRVQAHRDGPSWLRPPGWGRDRLAIGERGVAGSSDVACSASERAGQPGVILMNKYVLIVDDEPDIRAMLTDALEMEGIQVLTASHGEDALQHLRSGAPISVVLLDLMMPIMDGVQFVVEQAKDPSISGVPVVVFSGGRDHEQLRSYPIAAYLPKPVDFDLLLQTVHRFSS
jgi:CheY-like chemotaxis protein